MFSSTGSVTKTDGRSEAESAPTNIMDKKEDSLNKNYSIVDGSNKLGHSPCRWYISRLCDWLHERMVKLDKDNVLTRNIRTIQSSSNEGML